MERCPTSSCLLSSLFLATAGYLVFRLGQDVGPANREVAERFIFGRRDPVQELPDVPPGFEPVAGNRSWTVLADCPA